jgi:GNAT superfamily N-acetyltransferase
MTIIRALRPSDSLDDLTDLLHRAYKPLADAGMRFTASHQDAAKTAENIALGACFVAEQDGRIVGTINYRRPGALDDCHWYRRADVASFGQFAVEPSLQRGGLGALLIERVEAHARDHGMRELALDTSEHAVHLIAYYTRRGYRLVGTAQWDAVNYRSVIMSKTLPPSW